MYKCEQIVSNTHNTTHHTHTHILPSPFFGLAAHPHIQTLSHPLHNNYPLHTRMHTSPPPWSLGATLTRSPLPTTNTLTSHSTHTIYYPLHKTHTLSTTHYTRHTHYLLPTTRTHTHARTSPTQFFLGSHPHIRDLLLLAEQGQV
jgi:hypothetical protein